MPTVLSIYMEVKGDLAGSVSDTFDRSCVALGYFCNHPQTRYESVLHVKNKAVLLLHLEIGFQPPYFISHVGVFLCFFNLIIPLSPRLSFHRYESVLVFLLRTFTRYPLSRYSHVGVFVSFCLSVPPQAGVAISNNPKNSGHNFFI